MRRVRSALPWKAHVFMTIIALLSTAADVAHSFTITFDTASTTKVLFYQPSMETYEIQPGYLFQMSAVDPDRKNSTQIVSIHADRFFSKDVPSRNFSVYMFTYDLFPKTSLYISAGIYTSNNTLLTKPDGSPDIQEGLVYLRKVTNFTSTGPYPSASTSLTQTSSSSSRSGTSSSSTSSQTPITATATPFATTSVCEGCAWITPCESGSRCGQLDESSGVRLQPSASGLCSAIAILLCAMALALLM